MAAILSVSAEANSSLPMYFDSWNINNTSTAKQTETKELGTYASEVLKGSGNMAGYVLGHGSIITDSEWVSIGVKKAKRGTDYNIDYSNGSVYFLTTNKP